MNDRTINLLPLPLQAHTAAAILTIPLLLRSIVRAAGRGRHRRSPPRHVYSRAATVAEALAPPPPPAATASDAAGSSTPKPVDFDDLEPETMANCRCAPPLRARQAAVKAAALV